MARSPLAISFLMVILMLVDDFNSQKDKLFELIKDKSWFISIVPVFHSSKGKLLILNVKSYNVEELKSYLVNNGITISINIVVNNA